MSDSRLKNYALTAGSAAALAATGLAGADIQTSSGEPVSININQQLTILFSIDGEQFVAGNVTSQVYGTTSFTNFTAGFTGTAFDFNWKIVSSGVAVDNGLGFTGNSGLERRYAHTSVTHSTTDLPLGTNKLIAFSLESTETHYGWINYSLAQETDGYAFTVNSWAYNDIAGQGIFAGQNTAAGSSAVPGLGGLAALAIGAAGVRSRRQRTVA